MYYEKQEIHKIEEKIRSQKDSQYFFGVPEAEGWK
jgi:hypothetical protein